MAAQKGDTAPTTPTDKTQPKATLQQADASHLFASAYGFDEVKVSDKLLQQQKPTDSAAPANPYDLMQQARASAQELQTVLSQPNLKSTDTISVKDAQGHIQEVQAGDLVKQLKDNLNKTCSTAIGAADAIKQSGDPNSVGDQLTATNQQIGTLSKQLGINNPNSLSVSQVEQQIKAQPQGSAQAGQLNDLLNLVEKQQSLNALKSSPALTRFFYAQMKEAGLTDPSVTLENQQRTSATQLTPTANDLTDAFTLMGQAGRLDTEAANTATFKSTSADVTSQYAQLQQQRGQKAITELQQANQLNSQGKTSDADAAYQSALKDAEGVDLKFIAAQLKVPANQENPQVAQALTQIIVNATETRMDYANFLVNQGKNDQALPLLLKVQADTPELAAQDTSFNQLVQKATFGNTMSQSDLMKTQADYQTAMQGQNWDQAQKDLDTLKTNYQTTKAQLDKDDVVLNQQMTGIQTQLKDLQAKQSSMDPTEYQIQTNMLNAEAATYQQNLKLNAAFSAQYPQLVYQDGVLAYAKNDKATAYKDFQEVQQTDPTLAADPNSHVSELLAATKPDTPGIKGWFERNWQAVATGVAITAGVVAGALTIWSGPGAALAAGGTFAGTMALLGTGAAVGAVAGAGGYVATKGLIKGFNTVGWDDVKQGAEIGGMSGALSAAAFAGPLLGGAAGTTTESAGILGKVGSIAQSIGITGRSLAVGATISGAQQGYEVAFDNKSLKSAALDFATGTVSYASTFGLAGKFAGAVPTLASTMKAALTMGALTEGTKALLPTAIDAYENYSPWTIGFLGKPTHMQLDTNSATDQPLIAQRFSSVDNPNMMPDYGASAANDLPQANPNASLLAGDAAAAQPQQAAPADQPQPAPAQQQTAPAEAPQAAPAAPAAQATPAERQQPASAEQTAPAEQATPVEQPAEQAPSWKIRSPFYNNQ